MLATVTHIRRYKDNEPCFDLCLKIQQYYELYKCDTRVKVAGLLAVDQAMRLAGAQMMTIAPALLQELSETQAPDVEIEEKSIFNKPIKQQEGLSKPLPYIDDEVRWRNAFARSDGGKGSIKTRQACTAYS